MHGRAVNLSSYKNKIVVFDLFAFWCGACFPELSNSFSRLEKEFPGVSFIYVNASGKEIGGTPAVVKQQLLHQPKFSFLKKQTLLFPVNGLDDSLSIKGVPTTLILDKHGIAHPCGRGTYYRQRQWINLRCAPRESA
jgi:thiol-disulfide isomerase/thioredoxin